MVTLLFITPVFTHMSKNAQAAIVIVGVAGLLDLREARFLYKVHSGGRTHTAGVAAGPAPAGIAGI